MPSRTRGDVHGGPGRGRRIRGEPGRRARRVARKSRTGRNRAREAGREGLRGWNGKWPIKCTRYDYERQVWPEGGSQNTHEIPRLRSAALGKTGGAPGLRGRAVVSEGARQDEPRTGGCSPGFGRCVHFLPGCVQFSPGNCRMCSVFPAMCSLPGFAEGGIAAGGAGSGHPRETFAYPRGGCAEDPSSQPSPRGEGARAATPLRTRGRPCGIAVAGESRRQGRCPPGSGQCVQFLAGCVQFSPGNC